MKKHRWYSTIEAALLDALFFGKPFQCWVGHIKYKVYPSGKTCLLGN